MDDPQMRRRLELALEAARNAGKLALEYQRKGLEIDQKGVNDIVTDADLAVERLITNAIRKVFPQDGIFGEELGASGESQANRWIIDPIDGTENYARGIPEYAISIGFEMEPGRMGLGVVYTPGMNEIYWAMRGAGAYRNGVPIHVSDCSLARNAVCAMAPPFRLHEYAQQYFRLSEAVFLESCDCRNTGSAALHCCYVADGRVDAYLENGVMPYDIAAGLMILEEAGGRYDSLFTPGHPFDTHEILMANVALFPWLADMARRYR